MRWYSANRRWEGTEIQGECMWDRIIRCLGRTRCVFKVHGTRDCLGMDGAAVVGASWKLTTRGCRRPPNARFDPYGPPGSNFGRPNPDHIGFPPGSNFVM